MRSDHQALVWLFRLRDPRGEIARWLENLCQYDFSIEYRQGRKDGHCDALSLCENPKDCECPQQDTSEPLKCGPCSKCVKRAQEMMHKELCHEVLSVDSTSTEMKVEVNESAQPKVEGETAVKCVTQAEDSEQTEVRLDTELTNVKVLKVVNTGVSEATEPIPGPSNEGQSNPVERSGCANSASAWAGDKLLTNIGSQSLLIQSRLTALLTSLIARR